ncbi:MAG: DNA-binding response regulator [Methylophaga sp.]|nr:DNA-binding response regulator [Methylophaga sp.]
MTSMVKANFHIIASDNDLSQAIKSALLKSFNILTSSGLEEYLSSSTAEEVSLIICQSSILDNDEVAAIKDIKSINPNVRILIVGPSCASTEQISLLKHGVRGYFDTSESLDKLNEAVQCIIHGEVWIERYVISGLIDELAYVPEVNEVQRQAVSTLSPKELEVAQFVSHGATNKMIAKNMSITERTVKAHLTTIFQKMSLADRLSLAIFFRDLRE